MSKIASRGRIAAALVLAPGCGADHGAAAPPPRPAIAVAASPAPAPAAASASAVAVAATAEAAAPAAPRRVRVTATREIEAPVHAIALEKLPHAAALSDRDVWIHDQAGWRREALPAVAHHDASLELSLFYGRDYKPRLIGTRAEPAGPRSVTLRLLPEGIRSASGEIGRLGEPQGGLVAVLGTEDPEIVCKPADQCVVKRRSGWTFVPAPPDVSRVTLGGGTGWAVAGKRLLRLGAAWEPAGPEGTWDRADALFAFADRAFVVDGRQSALHAFDGSRWTVTPSPVAAPRALWGTAPDDLWLAGDGGLARFDGAWAVADAPEGPLHAVLGRARDDVWVGGPGGLFRVGLAP